MTTSPAALRLLAVAGSGAGWFVDIDIDVDFDGSTLAQTGFTGLQLTGPAAHNNIAPFPGTFSTGRDDHPWRLLGSSGRCAR